MSDLETRFKALEDQNKALQNRIRTLEDIEEIKILQRCYGYYYEHGMGQELADLYADGPDVSVHWLGQGSFVGKENIKKLYKMFGEFMRPEMIHEIIQLSGIVHVDPDGKTANGRWYGLGIYDFAAGQGALGISLYETEYVKQNGKWKIKMLEHSFDLQAKLDIILQPPQTLDDESHMGGYPFTTRNTEFNPTHPSGYIRPFHFKHPVTGKETSEAVRNATLKNLKRVETWVNKL